MVASLLKLVLRATVPTGTAPTRNTRSWPGKQRATSITNSMLSRGGDRQSDVMAKIAAALTDAGAADLASFYSQQAIHSDTVKDTSLAAVGERIFSAGIDSTGVPACTACHGSPGQPQVPIIGREMMGPGMMQDMPMMEMMSSAPNLNGQHAAYIIDQLNRFAARHREDLVMDRIALLLRDADKKAVAEYLSGLQ